MSKKIRMLLFGDTGVGKSTFASKFPKPFFISTDGNYEWLGLPDEDHKQVSNWDEFLEAVRKDYAADGYQTVVVDLVDNVFDFSEIDLITKKKVDHISEIGSMGKGYDLYRKRVLLALRELFAKNINILLLSHESVRTVKNRLGVENHVYTPSGSIPNGEKKSYLDEIIGMCQFCLRAYLKTESDGETIIKTRQLSLIPKENEKAIARNLNESVIPTDIDLDVKEFFKWINYTIDSSTPKTSVKEPVKKEIKPMVKKDVPVNPAEEFTEDDLKEHTAKKEITNSVIKEKSTEKPKPTKTVSPDDKIAAIKAKLAAMKAKKK